MCSHIFPDTPAWLECTPVLKCIQASTSRNTETDWSLRQWGPAFKGWERLARERREASGHTAGFWGGHLTVEPVLRVANWGQ